MSSTFRLRPSPRDRLRAIVLAVGLVALLILLLLRLGVLPTPTRPKAAKTFALYPQGEREAATRRQAARAAPRRPVQPTPAPPPPAPVPPPVPAPFPALQLSHDDFAAGDIGHIARAPAKGADDAEGGADSVATYGPGAGPGGQRLYKAEWYREPPPSALALYLPGGPQPGWALIACRTAPGMKVENCRELDESPRGSGLARALRQAAWQFQVRPPRLGGKPLIGAWVSIRFDFTEGRPG